jgi:hypothetical protein
LHSEPRDAADSESHRTCCSPPLLILLPHSPTSPSSPQPLPQMPKSRSPGTPTIIPALTITSCTSWCLQAVSHSKPHLRTHTAFAPHPPNQPKKNKNKIHLPHNSPPKSLDHPQTRPLACKQPHDPANAKPPTQRRKVNSNPRPPDREKKQRNRRPLPHHKNKPMTQGDRHTLATPLPIRSSLLRHPTRPIELLTPY